MEASIPKIGKKYHFFDDGKVSPSRHFVAEVTKLLSPKEAKKIMFDDESLYRIWKEAIKKHSSTNNFTVGSTKAGEPWLYAIDTDYFVELSIPEYDDNLLYAVRTIHGDWFTLCIQSFWQGGILDVDGNIFRQWEELWPDKYFENIIEE